MDSIVSSALEEICSQGNSGISLVFLWLRLSPPVSPSVKPCVWRNLLAVPQLQFKVKNTVYGPTDASIQRLEDAEKLDLRIVASEKLRDNFVGLYDAQSSNTSISSVQRHVLEWLAIARANGVAQNQLAKEFGIEGRNLFYILRHLESRGLIMRQPAIVRTRELDDEGESKSTSCVSTNMICLSRYAKPLGAQQRFEIIKENSSVETPLKENEAAVARDSPMSEREDMLIKDFLPSMQAICDKLEDANGKVLVISDVKHDLGYTGSYSGHRAWRNVCRRLKDSHIIEEFDAVVNNKVERCLRLLKKFSSKDFESKSVGYGNYSEKKHLLKFGRSIQRTDQIVELPLDRQIYDMVDAEGSKGLAVVEVCDRLGIDKKRSYSRLCSMFSRVGMHLQAESHKKTTVFRVWTSQNVGPESSNALTNKPGNVNRENNLSVLDPGKPDVNGGLAQTLTECGHSACEVDSATPGKLTDIESNSGASCGSPLDTKTNNRLTCHANLEKSFHEISDDASNAEIGAETDIPDLAPSGTKCAALVKLPKAKVRHAHPVTVDHTRREQRILERLQEEKFVLRAELHKWLVSLEKDKSSKMDRKTIDRMLNKLQQQGRCKCMAINVPNVTNCGRNRCSMVVLHPSIRSLSPDVIGEIHDRIRSFEMGLRGQSLLKGKSNESVPVLNGVHRSQNNMDLDARASRSEAMRANGFVLAKMVRAKLLHCFLWDYSSTLPDWENALSSANEHKFHNMFSLEDALKSMQLELFLRIVGSIQKFDDLIKKCKWDLCLSDLPNEQYKLLMDTLAIGRLSLLIDILRRLKLIRLVNSGHRRNEVEEKYATLTHMELKPYIEEPAFVSTVSCIESLDLRPRIRHDFILSSREAVDEYWLTLEYCYAAADQRAAVQAFPGSVVHEVHRVYHDKHQRRLSRFKVIPISENENQAAENKPSSSSHKRKRFQFATAVKTTGHGFNSEKVGKQRVLDTDTGDKSKRDQNPLDSLQDDNTPVPMHQEGKHQGIADDREPTEDEERCCSIIKQYASLKTKATCQPRFSWTDVADRQLLIQYVRHRAFLGPRFHVTDWASVTELPATDYACKRRIASLMRNEKFRKALMRLCTLLSERYARHLERKQKSSPDSKGSHVLVRCSCEEIVRSHSHCVEHDKDASCDEERWDDFNDKSIRQAFDDVLELKKMAKLASLKRIRSGSQERSNTDIADKEHEDELVQSATHAEDTKNVAEGRDKDSAQRFRHCRIHQKIKLPNEEVSTNVQVQQSLVISNAIELLKLVFLSMRTVPGIPNLLEDTLRRYSEQDLFAAYSYLRDKKFLIGGSGGHPFVLSQNFLHNISRSPFPINTGKRAAKFSNWLLENERDLMAGGVNLTTDLQCGDIFQFFSLVSSGELSISASLPDEGVGEPEDPRSLKRRADDIEEYDADKAKKLKLLAEGEPSFRREKGFPGITVSVRRPTLSATDAVESFKDDDSRNNELRINLGATNVDCKSDDTDELFNSGDATVVPGNLGDSPWEAMAGYANYTVSKSAEGQVNFFSPEVFKIVSSALQKAGDQGLVMEEVCRLVDIPGEKMCEWIIDVLQTFGLALKVNAYDNVRVVDALYRSKYFLTTEAGNLQLPLPAKSLEEGSGELKLNPVSTSCGTSPREIRAIVNGMHRVTILNLPEVSEAGDLHEASVQNLAASSGTNSNGESRESSFGETCVPIFPWINADGTVNKIVFSGLVRRVLGTVMQNPGVKEDEIICRMDILNPQSCRKLLELMTLDGHIKAREMLQTKSEGSPSLLGCLLHNRSRKPVLVRHKHFFANPRSLYAL